MRPPAPSDRSLGHRIASIITALCILTVAAWELAIFRAKTITPTAPLSPAQFAGLKFEWQGAQAKPLSLQFDDSQANLLVMSVPLSDTNGNTRHVTLRLVHGYNMRDCMRIKGYQVTQRSSVATNHPIESWELISSGGDRSVWLTAMVRSSDFSYMPISVTELEFPRVGIPDERDWEFKGATEASAKHPVQNLKNLIRAKWNGARANPGTFLRIQPPAHPSSAVLTLIALTDEESDADAIGLTQQLRPLLDAFRETLRSSRTP